MLAETNFRFIKYLSISFRTTAKSDKVDSPYHSKSSQLVIFGKTSASPIPWKQAWNFDSSLDREFLMTIAIRTLFKPIIIYKTTFITVISYLLCEMCNS